MTSADLQRRRRKLKFTQTDLAKTFGVTKQTVINWENDHSPIKPIVDWAIKGLENARNV